jgi:hypothetical protein
MVQVGSLILLSCAPFIPDFIMEKIILERNVKWCELRGRPPSIEYLQLRALRVGSWSFTSTKARKTLYAIARNLGYRVKVLEERPGARVWRVWKLGLRKPKPLSSTEAPDPATLASQGKNHGRKKVD